ncbi:MAG TPA: hypothetical protein VK735_16460 [Pseudonocardia sp.]|uniref:hypothetical protein n=1 Tax=Pseudonocardia sp. TaxID=60912 RepID=UPI002BD7203C|nr:hypothetical protein [Pseudonocardia sp.]HTF49040.1 hypothetical protein [Pseudonocardia sp.]
MSKVDMNIPTTTTASGTIHPCFATAPPGGGEGFTGGSGGRCGGEGGVRLGRVVAPASRSALERSATPPPPELVSALFSPRGLPPL